MSHGPNARNRAVIELSFAGVLWGFSFIAAKWTFESFTVESLMFFRFFFAFAVGLILAAIFKFSELKKYWKQDAKSALRVGISLGITLWFQTLALKYTTATNTSFITTLYVIQIPLIMAVYNRKLNIQVITIALLALLGMAFLVFPDGNFHMEFNQGDILALICSFFASLQIIFMGVDAKNSSDAFRFNLFQTFWSGVMVLPFILISTERILPKWPLSEKAIFGFILISIGSSLIAFYLQTRAQKHLSTELSSLLFLLEAPFATLFGFIFLKESLTWLSFLGGALILLSCYFSMRTEAKTTKI